MPAFLADAVAIGKNNVLICTQGYRQTNRRARGSYSRYQVQPGNEILVGYRLSTVAEFPTGL